MSTNIGKSEIENFFIKKYDSNHITFENVKKLGIDVEKFKYADTNDNNEFDLDEIIDAKDLYAAFVSVVQKDMDSVAERKDDDKEKAEKNKVQEKSSAGGA